MRAGMLMLKLLISVIARYLNLVDDQSKQARLSGRRLYRLSFLLLFCKTILAASFSQLQLFRTYYRYTVYRETASAA